MANGKPLRWGKLPETPSVFYLTVVYKGRPPELVEVQGTPSPGNSVQFRPTAKKGEEALADGPWTTARCTQIVGAAGTGPTLYYLE